MCDTHRAEQRGQVERVRLEEVAGQQGGQVARVDGGRAPRAAPAVAEAAAEGVLRVLRPSDGGGGPRFG